ncbi:HpcH/HpaI aldolase family protein [Aliiruegeria sabulilitoris]|uniref:HpcH/HpaI aldolase family protein n=1 Tax=Aliiruegeria sabulilitoris TaxID=1510458 RepID=UPI00082CF9DA|nr:aldolase/citrate lyase family protein [Aliiruegeria sabulilitoris]NDR58217.1 aldolase [Pseudoruegeria sp. M32A2M]
MKGRNWLRDQIAAGRCVRAIWLDLGIPSIAEAAVWAGWDCVVIDNEHGPAGLETTMHIIRAVEAAGGHAIVRAPWNDQVYLKRLQEIGAKSIMIPMICNGEQAKAAADACRYPPNGTRGYAAPVGRATQYGTNTGYLATHNEETFVIAQIEHKDAIPNIADIAAVDGIDMLFLGPNDLAGTVGLLEQLDKPEAEALAAETERRILETDKLMGTVSRPAYNHAELKERGHNLIVGEVDILLIMETFRKANAKMAEALGDKIAEAGETKTY